MDDGGQEWDLDPPSLEDSDGDDLGDDLWGWYSSDESGEGEEEEYELDNSSDYLDGLKQDEEKILEGWKESYGFPFLLFIRTDPDHKREIFDSIEAIYTVFELQRQHFPLLSNKFRADYSVPSLVLIKDRINHKTLRELESAEQVRGWIEANV